MLQHFILACSVVLGASQPDTPQTSGQLTPLYRIQVLDRSTGRGVPMIELRTTWGARYYTDNAGIVAYYEPGMMGKETWFHVSGHGYEHPADGFGYRGVRLTPTQGGRATIRVDRVNIAERLYRLTGVGVYRDSRLLGESTPLAEPDIRGLVTGQDSAHAHVHNGQVYWFWGDTNRPSYPLGNFKTAGATSQLPSSGGLAPGVGVDLDYYVDSAGFARQMAPVAGSGVVWIEGVQSAPDPSGTPRMFAHFERRQGLGELYEQGVLIWNENTETFEVGVSLPIDEPLHPLGWQPFVHTTGGVVHLYFSKPYPHLRVRHELTAVLDPAQYEGFTPLAPGARYDGVNTQLERDGQGRLIWAWKADTPPLTPDQQRELINAGLFERSDSPFRLFDVDTGKQIREHFGSVAWNDYLQKFVMIFGQSGGDSSFLGEIFIAAADAPEGPWVHARKIVTHDDYAFYNVAQRDFFDEDGGRLIYFEGTYTRTFSGTEVETPCFDYNQIMYRVDLADPRLRVR